MKRRNSKQVRVGNLAIGGDAPVSIQSMLNTPAHDIEGSVRQAKELEAAGFFMRSSGVSTYYGNTTMAISQSLAGGETAAIGTVVDVQFSNVVEDGSVETR